MTEITSVLFVCLGNICRSPMAEAVFQSVIDKRNYSSNFRVDSAGTADYHVCKQDFYEFDYILCMDESNLQDLRSIQPANSKAVVKLFGKYDSEKDEIIRDPYYGGVDGFDYNFAQVTRCSHGFLKSLSIV
ncbi:Low molecular weight phosphotyrosine protein phosphatase [Dispira parvispora]|uniref:protein-tyrosine-phosphatase n=1 Tax=Dispira parvispora TaxID=1520584 RepID=A0A9W8E4U1_9FUNG|nr:Low molecular weight phosphotyrosine protein phosphatase [Dispira parvispora]